MFNIFNIMTQNNSFNGNITIFTPLNLLDMIYHKSTRCLLNYMLHIYNIYYEL